MLSRRQFCILGGGALAACSDGPTTLPPDMTLATDMAAHCVGMKLYAGSASSFGVGTATLFPCANVFICRDGQGLYAMSSLCTHNACTPNFLDARQGFLCPCHGSRYDFNGAVTMSPAMFALVHFPISFDANHNVIVDSATTVPATMRY